jgi:hypothetical protein
VAGVELPTSSVSEKSTGVVSQKKLANRFQGGEGHKGWTGDNVTAHHRMDIVFAKMTQVLPGLDLLTKKMVDKGDMDDLNLQQEKGLGIPTKSGDSIMKLNTAAFSTDLLKRVKKKFSRLDDG